jgi:hypothetical protein
METEDIGELDEADLQLPNGTLNFFVQKLMFWDFFSRGFCNLKFEISMWDF